MKKEEIHLDDIRRILLGDAPPEILIEVIIRSLVLYMGLILVVRLLGKRTNSILTITERAVFITLGAIVAMPMHGPNHGIVIGLIVLITVLALQRGFTGSFFISRRWEELMQGQVFALVKDSVIDVNQIDTLFISRQQLFELLREKDIRHLGQVKRAYIEAAGTISIYKYKEVQSGLSILPINDIDKIISIDKKHKACSWCGARVNNGYSGNCPNCERNKWVAPSTEFVKDE